MKNALLNLLASEPTDDMVYDWMHRNLPHEKRSISEILQEDFGVRMSEDGMPLD